jgi:DNA polymerase III sliding clamp (beta) subunit (PCNA family)
MKIQKEELRKALEIVKPGLANKEIAEQTSSFAFIDGFVVTYNDSISIRHPIGDLGLNGAIRAEKMYKLLSKIKKDEIEIQIDKTELTITTGRAEAKLAIETEITMPILDIKKITKKFQDLPDNFSQNLRFAMQSCSRDMSRPVLTAVHIREDGGLEGSDGFRLARIRGDGMPVADFLLPADSAAQVVKLKPARICLESAWVHFQNEEGTIISSRIFEDDVYPKVDHIFEFAGEELSLPKSIADILDRATIFSSDSDHFLDQQVTVQIENNKAIISGECSTGSYKETANIRYEGEKIQFSMTPHLFKDILTETHECVVGEGRIKFTGENWEYLGMLRND